MPTPNSLTPTDLRAAIVRDPLVVSPDITVMAAIVAMSNLRAICTTDAAGGYVDTVHQEARSSCVLVMAGEQILGILTERDLVRLSAQQRSLESATVGEVMTSPVLTLREEEFTDLFSAVNLLQQRRIRHLPIVDQAGHLLGILTHESLRQLARPVDLLRLRLVSEVMTANVVCAPPDTSMLTIAQRMAERRVGSVLVTATQVDAAGNPLPIPLGIITERDIVQFQSLGLQLDRVEVQVVMSAPVFTVQPDDSLMVVQQVMEQRSIRRLVVTGAQGELLGIVTQTSLLQALNPLELYTLSKILEEKVAQLEAEKVTLLETYTLELERQVQQCAMEINARIEREQMMAEISATIAASLHLPEILNTTVQELRSFLRCDRVVIWQRQPDGNGIIAAESVGEGWRASLHDAIDDFCFRGADAQRYLNRGTIAIENIHTVGYPDCYLALLEMYQVKANLVVPIRVDGQLWGLLVGHQCADYRQWHTSDLALLDEMAVQLAIAIQQATAYQQAQAELAERQRIEAALRESEQRFRAIFDNMFQFIGLLSPDGTLLEANQTALTVGGLQHQDVVGRPFWEAGWWQISPDTQAQLQQAIARAAQGEFVRYEVDVWGANQTVIPIDFSLRPIFDEDDRVVLLIPESRDLRELKRRELELIQSEQRFASLAAAAPVGIFHTDAEGNCLYVNDRWCQIAGLTPTEAAGFGWVTSIHPDDRDLVAAEWNASVAANHPFSLEYRFLNAAGQITWAYGQAVAEHDEAGTITGYVGTITDISDRKAAEQSLKIQRDFNQLIAEITSRFVDLNPEDLDAEINRCLQLVGEVTQLDTSFIIKFDDDAPTMSMSHEWCLPQYPRQIALAQAIPQAAFPWSTSLLQQREINYIPSVADLPAVAAIDQASWQRFSLTAVLAVPLVQKSAVTGLMGFASFSQTRTWDEETIRLLCVMGQTIANAQQRAHDEQQLFEKEERLRLALMAANQGLYDLNLQTGEAVVSPEYATMLGYDPATFQETNANWLERMHPDDRELVAAVYQAYVAGEIPSYKVEFRQRTQAGTWQWILSLGKIVAWDEAGQPLRMLGTHTDISDRKQAEAALLESEIRFRAFIDNSPAAAWICDPNDGLLEYVSQSYHRMFLVPNTVMGQTVADLYPPDIAQIYLNNTQWVAVTGNTLETIEPGTRADNSPGEFLVLKFPLPQTDGRLLVGGVAIDVTDRQRASAERLRAESLKRELTLLETIFDTILAGYWDADLVAHQNYISPGFKTMFGYEDHELANSPETWKQLILPEDLPKAIAAYTNHVQSHGTIPYYNELRYRHKNGSIVWVICSGRVIEWDEAGNPLRLIGCHIDITPQKQAEEALRLSEERLQLALEAAGDGLWDWNVATDDLYLSPQWVTMLGFEPGDLPANISVWEQLVHPDDKPWVMERLNAHFQDVSIPYKFDYRVQTKMGSYRWIANYGKVVLRDDQGNPLRMIGTHRDITASKLVEEQLRRSSAHLKTAQRIGKLGSWEFNVQTGSVYWSDEVFRIFGLPPDSAPPSFEELQQVLHPDDRDRHQQVVQTAIETAQPYSIELCAQRPDGSVVYMYAQGEPIVNAAGELVYLVGTVLDITDRKESEKQLRDLSDRLNLAIKSAAIAIWEWNVPENILIWDDRMYELYGITADQFTSVYAAWASSLHPDDRLLAETAIQQALAGEKDYDPEFRVVHPDGSIRYIQAYAVVQRNDQGDPQRMIGINFDITDRKQAELNLLRTTAQLEASNRELEAFAYSVSHDLRSPLRAIDGFSMALLEDYGDQFDGEGKDYFDRIRKNVTRMGMLIDDLLNLSRVSRSEICYTTINLSTVAQELMNELQGAEPERVVEVSIASDVTVFADATLMRVVLTNLLQNAWKFTSHHPTARIEFGVIHQDGDPTYFVRDDGAGFDMAFANMLFGVFQRLHNTNEFPGTGIGLATVQRAIHRHGGRVWAEAAVEQGAAIYFTMPTTHLTEGI